MYLNEFDSDQARSSDRILVTGKRTRTKTEGVSVVKIANR